MVAACMIPQIILISYKKRLFDVVDKRKVHEGVIPRLGGVAFALHHHIVCPLRLA